MTTADAVPGVFGTNERGKHDDEKAEGTLVRNDARLNDVADSRALRLPGLRTPAFGALDLKHSENALHRSVVVYK